MSQHAPYVAHNFLHSSFRRLAVSAFGVASASMLLMSQACAALPTTTAAQNQAYNQTYNQALPSNEPAAYRRMPAQLQTQATQIQAVQTQALPNTANTTGTTNSGIAMNITAQLVGNDNGQETLMPLTAQTRLAKGNVIEYHVYLTNTNSDRVRTMKANVAIPSGVKLLGAVSPEAMKGSVDGQNFYPMPLRMQVGGQTQPIPLDQYKALQWQIEDVGLNQTAKVSYRVVVE